MPSVGDLTVGFGLDDSKWVRDVLRIQNQTKAVAGSINGDLGRSLGQVGFALQDFSSVLGMGGKNALGRALMSTMNNVQMLGSAFGPMGLAVTAVGGALGSILIPKLLESGNAAKTMADNINDSLSSMEDLAKSAATLSRELIAIGNVDTSKSMKGKLDDMKAEMRLTGKARSDLENSLTESFEKAVKDGLFNPAAAAKTPVGGVGGLPLDPVSAFAKHIENKYGTVLGADPFADSRMRDDAGIASKIRSAEVVGKEGEDAKAALLKGLEALDKLREEEMRLSTVRTAGAVKLKEIERDEAGKRIEKTGAADLKRRMDAYADNLEESAKIIENSRSKFDIAKDRMKDIEAFAGMGLLSPAQANKAAKDVIKDFSDATGAKTGHPNTAAIGGTSEGFSALQASIRQGNDRSNDQLAVLRQMASTLTQQLAAMRNIGTAAANPTVGIGGGL